MRHFSRQELEGKYPDGLPQLDPVEDLGIVDAEMSGAVRRSEALEARLAANPVFAAQRDSTRCACNLSIHHRV